jgi:hypothetical protein
MAFSIRAGLRRVYEMLCHLVPLGPSVSSLLGPGAGKRGSRVLHRMGQVRTFRVRRRPARLTASSPGHGQQPALRETAATPKMNWLMDRQPHPNPFVSGRAQSRSSGSRGGGAVTHPVSGDFHAIRKTTLSRKIIGQIRDLIAAGQLKPGDRLPPERELARSLGVGHTTVREAIRSMESLELLVVRPGKGTFIAGPTSQDPDPAFEVR